MGDRENSEADENLSDWEMIRSEVISERLIEPAKRSHPSTEFTLDTSEAVKALEASEKPVFEVGHFGEYHEDTPDIEWTQHSVSEALMFYEELSEEFVDIFGDNSVVHFYERFDLNDELRLSDKIDSDSERYRLWLYAEGTPQLVMQGLVNDDEAQQLEPVGGSKWEVDHYLREGGYLSEEEIIRSKVPSGSEIVEVMNREPDEPKVGELERLWTEYVPDEVSNMEKSSEYSRLFEKVKGMEYNPEDVRELSKRHKELKESQNATREQRFGLLLSAMMNASDHEAFPVTGYWSTGYRNEGNDIFVEDDAPWLGMEMQEGTVSAPYSFSFNETGERYDVEKLGYLQIVEARRKGLQD